MAFVTCSQFNRSQTEQDEKIAALSGSISAEESLLDKSGGGSGKVTAEKIKEAINGNISVTVQENSGIKGDGTQGSPLALNLGDSLAVDGDGKINIDAEKIKEALGVVRLVDASGAHHLANVIGV